MKKREARQVELVPPARVRRVGDEIAGDVLDGPRRPDALVRHQPIPRLWKPNSPCFQPMLQSPLLGFKVIPSLLNFHAHAGGEGQQEESREPTPHQNQRDARARANQEQWARCVAVMFLTQASGFEQYLWRQNTTKLPNTYLHTYLPGFQVKVRRLTI